MAAAKSPVGPRELSRRDRRIRSYVGQQIAEQRGEAGISAAALAAAAHVDQAHLWRIERGLAHASLEVLDRIAACLGAELSVRLFPSGGPRVRDRFQAPIVEAIIRLLDSGHTAFPELPVPRARGFVDLAIRLAAEGFGVASEIHSEVRAMDTVQRRLREKSLGLAELGTVGREVSMLLVVRSTRRTREVARLFGATLGATFPARSEDAYDALFTPDGAWPGPAILWARLENGHVELLRQPPRGVRVGR